MALQYSIIRYYERSRALILGGLLGMLPKSIIKYFRSLKYIVTETTKASKFDSVAKKNKANIIWFAHKTGYHFVALNVRAKSITGYNTYSNSSGPDNWGSTIAGFLKKKNYKGKTLISIR